MEIFYYFSIPLKQQANIMDIKTKKLELLNWIIPIKTINVPLLVS